MWYEWAVSLWWWVLCLTLSAVGARGCKKKTICRPPPGGKPGCGGRK